MRRTGYFVAAIVVLVALLLPYHVRQDLGWIDSVSGSRKSQMVWRLGGSSTAVVSESPLAARYRQLGLQWEPDWRNVKGTSLNVFGRSVGRAHGQAPAIYDLAMDVQLQQAFVAASSDHEVREFFSIMSSSAEAEQKAAVDAACDKALRSQFAPS